MCPNTSCAYNGDFKICTVYVHEKQSINTIKKKHFFLVNFFQFYENKG